MTKTSVKLLNLFVVVAMVLSAAMVSAKPAQAAADVSPYAYQVRILWPAFGLVDIAHVEGTYAKPYGAYFKTGSTILAQYVVGDPTATWDSVTSTFSSCTPQAGFVRYWIGSTRAVSTAEYPGARPVADICAPTVAERSFAMPAKADGYYFFSVDVTTDPDPAHWTTDIVWGKDTEQNALVSDNTKPTGTLVAPSAGEVLVANRQYQVKWTAADLPVGNKPITMRAQYLLTTTANTIQDAYDGKHGSTWYTVCTVPLVDVPVDPTGVNYPLTVTQKVCPTGMEVNETNPLWWVDPMLMSPYAILRITLTDVAGNSIQITSGAFQIIGVDNTTPITGLVIPAPIDSSNEARGVWPVIAYARDDESGILHVKFQYATQDAPNTWLDITGTYQFDPYLPLASNFPYAANIAVLNTVGIGNHWFFVGWDTSALAGKIVRVRVTSTNGVGANNINDTFSDPRCPFGTCFPVSQWVKILPAPIKIEFTRPIDGGVVHINGCGQISPWNAMPDLPSYDTFRSLVTVRASAIDSAAGIFRVELGANGVNDWMPLYSSEAVTGIPDTYTGYLNTAGLAAGDTITLEARAWTHTNEWYPAYATVKVEDGASFFGCSFEKELMPGWNLISLPLIPDNSAVANVLKTVTKASYLNTVDTWTWKTTLTSERYAPKVPVTTLTSMVDGKGYWVNVSDLTALSYAGGFANDPATVMPSYQVYKGWNLIGFTPWIDPTIGANVFFNQTVAQYLRPDLVSKTQAMYMFDPLDKIYRWVNLTDDMEAGMGYWLATSAESVIFP